MKDSAPTLESLAERLATSCARYSKIMGRDTDHSFFIENPNAVVLVYMGDRADEARNALSVLSRLQNQDGRGHA